MTANNNAVLECVPNFSEGNDQQIIDLISGAIKAVSGVQLLHVDPGAAANRVVMTFAGPPADVVEAAYQAIRVAAQNIDMQTHTGNHPRLGATDVCPLVPLSKISMKEAVDFSYRLGSRVGNELGIPVYYYENSAKANYRTSLPQIRKGGYEGLAAKMKQNGWTPDEGPAAFNKRSGATVIGARQLLVAYNVNLDTKDQSAAQQIAEKVRTSGSWVVDGFGRRMKSNGVNQLPALRAIGWYVPEYECAQVSTNIIDLDKTTVFDVFYAVRKVAATLGIGVTGSELIGMVPLKALSITPFNHSNDNKKIQQAIETLSLNDKAPFLPEERILELRLEV